MARQARLAVTTQGFSSPSHPLGDEDGDEDEDEDEDG
jgi:hypothetical protein